MTQPLVPTRIVNKNGVHTTVYKAAGNQSMEQNQKLPAPALTGVPVPQLAMVLQRLRMTLADPFTTTPSSITPSQIEKTLDGYPDETQEYIADVVGRDKDDDNYLDRLIISMLDKRRSPEEVEDSLFVYENLPDSWDSLTYGTNWDDDGFEVDCNLLHTVNGARGYTAENYAYGNEDISLRHYDEKTQKQVLALLELLFEMERTGETNSGLSYDDTSIYIQDRGTVQFIADNPERSMEVAQLMQERGTDWGTLNEVMNAPSAPLREGTL